MTIRKNSLFFYLILLFAALTFAACTPGSFEPGAEGIPVTREDGSTPTPNSIPTASPTSGEILEEPTLSETDIAILTATPTPFDVPSETPPVTITATEGPPPTMTPAPPFPGFRYETEAGIWQVDGGWQPKLLVEQTDVILSDDASQGLYLEEGDIWLLDVANGDRLNLTEGSGRRYCCPQWWPARPGIIVSGSWEADDFSPSRGALTTIQIDGSGVTVMADNDSIAEAALSPDGQQIAFDMSGSAWIYDFETDESTQFNPENYGINGLRSIGGASWSPDGKKLAWTIATTDPDWRISVLVFDLETDQVSQFHIYENLGRGGWFPGPAWHPEGEWLAFLAEAADPSQFGLWAINISSEEEVYVGRGFNPIFSPDGQWLAYEQFGSSGNLESLPMIAEVGSWYQINMYIPENGRLLDWVNTD